MPDLRSFHAEVGRVWIDAHRGSQSQAELTLLDLGFMILQRLAESNGSLQEGPEDVRTPIVVLIGDYVNLAHSIFDPMPTPTPPWSNHSE